MGEDGIPNMYKNREPRFYQDITYSGKVWQKTDKKIYFYKGMPDDNSKADMSYSGYLLYKGMNRDLLNQGNNPKSKYRAGMLFRLADFYLLYAEALNHVNPGDARIIQYVDSVRYRAGIPLLKDIKPEIIGNRELQEKRSVTSVVSNCLPKDNAILMCAVGCVLKRRVINKVVRFMVWI